MNFYDILDIFFNTKPGSKYTLKKVRNLSCVKKIVINIKTNYERRLIARIFFNNRRLYNHQMYKLYIYMDKFVYLEIGIF